MKRKIIKVMPLIACMAANAAIAWFFGPKAWALSVIVLIAFAIWAAMFYAEQEEKAVAATAAAVAKIVGRQHEPDENI